MECTKVNCPLQVGTPTDNCSEDCPWRTTAKEGDLISMWAAIDALTDTNLRRNVDSVYDDDMNRARRAAQRIIANLPVIDASPVIHGRWVKMTGMMPPEHVGHYECSVCQWHGSHHTNVKECEYQFCPNCGAKMDED